MLSQNYISVNQRIESVDPTMLNITVNILVKIIHTK